MGRVKPRTQHARNAIKERYQKRRLRSDEIGAPQAGPYGGASEASFLAPLDPTVSLRRRSLSPPPFDPSSIKRDRKIVRAQSDEVGPPTKSDIEILAQIGQDAIDEFKQAPASTPARTSFRQAI